MELFTGYRRVPFDVDVKPDYSLSLGVLCIWGALAFGHLSDFRGEDL